MGIVKWGVIAAIVAAVVILVLAAPGLLPTGDESEEKSSSSGEESSGTPKVTEAAERAAGDRATVTRIEAGEADVRSDIETSTAPKSARDESDAALQEEAESFVNRLAGPSDEPLAVEHAEGFVGPDRPLVAKTGQSTAAPTPRAGGDEIGAQGRALPPEAAEAGSNSVSQAKTADSGANAGVRGLEAGPAAAKDTPQPEVAGPAAQTTPGPTVDLPLNEETPVTIAELLGPENIPSNAVFYVHTVNPGDDQGIWGIVHHGIVGNFAEGVAIHRGETTETYRIDIPRNADERRPDSSSSFLGKLIHAKSRQSYVYNFQAERIGKNPDVIIPGQEIVIVAFTPAELVTVYKHFVR